MRGCPTTYVLENREAIEAGLNMEDANKYLKGASCPMVGRELTFPNGRKVKVVDLLVKVVISSGFKVYLN